MHLTRMFIGGLMLLLTSAFSLVCADPPLVVYATNFDEELFELPGVSGEFSGAGRPEGVQSWWGLGHGANIFSGRFLRNNASGNPAPATTLTLEGLPRHDSIDIHFLLAMIDSWDGDAQTAGPDFLNMTLDGAVIFSETFANPGTGSFFPRPEVELAAGVQLGFTGGDFVDAAYDFGKDPDFSGIPHTASTATISWLASGLGYEGGDNESFAIDNVRIRLGGTLSDTGCDLNDDAVCDAFDIDLLSLAVRDGSDVMLFDVNGDSTVTVADHRYLVHELMRTYLGDSNLDGEFNSSDMVDVFEAGKYETKEYAGWSRGDWNADLIFDSSDMVAAFIDGGYEKGPQSRAAAVPEPGGWLLMAMGLLLSTFGRRAHRPL